MILISHRGNLNSKMDSCENEPTYIDLAISRGYDVEVDIWYKDNKLWLGHDKPDYDIEIEWLVIRSSKLWIHCKNIESLYYLKSSQKDLNYFWHQEDDVTITSKGYFWTYPGKKLTPNSIAVLPEQSKFDNLDTSLGICSDFIERYG